MRLYDLNYCPDCEHEIIVEDDEACVCIECGGRNRRMFEPTIWGDFKVLFGGLPTAVLGVLIGFALMVLVLLVAE